MSKTRKRFIALLIASLLCMGAGATLSGGEASNPKKAALEKISAGEMFEPTQHAPMSPTWLVSDFSWM